MDKLIRKIRRVFDSEVNQHVRLCLGASCCLGYGSNFKLDTLTSLERQATMLSL